MEPFCRCFVSILFIASSLMQITVRAPASTSNLGPGFDIFGLALSLYSVFTFERSEALQISGCPEAFQNEDNLVLQGFREVFREAGQTPFSVKLHIDAEVPVARGLGSSSTCIAAGAAAANAFLGSPFAKDELFQICARFEGHPDNAAPVTFGGFTASFASDERFHALRMPLDQNWKFAVIIPDYEVRTADARRAMPKEIAVKDSVFTTSHAIAMIEALRSGSEELLAEACQDVLHEPCRRKLIKDYDSVRASAKAAGAPAFFISGSGSTMIALTKSETVAKRFIELVRARHPNFAGHVLHAAADGVRVETK